MQARELRDPRSVVLLVDDDPGVPRRSKTEAEIQPYIGVGRNLSVGTNVLIDTETGAVRWQGVNLSIGYSIEITLGDIFVAGNFC